MTRKEKLDQVATHCGLVWDEWSPGDGVTRYRFARAGGRGDCYFSMDPLYTALGIGEAEVYLRGYRHGMEAS